MNTIGFGIYYSCVVMNTNSNTNAEPVRKLWVANSVNLTLILSVKGVLR